MLVKKHNLLLDKLDESGTPSGYGTSETKVDTKTAETAGNNSAADKGAAKGTEDKTAATDDKSKQAETSEKSEKTEDLTGYKAADDKSKDDKAAEDKSKDDDKTKDDKSKDQYKDLDFKGLDPEKNKDLIEFASKAGMTKEQAQALVEKRKEHMDLQAAEVQKFEDSKKETFTRWEKELTTDWGSEFNQNVKAVNDFATNHLPNLTKVLTSNGGRLSPSEMKEILALALKTNSETSFTEGDAGKSKQEQRHPSDYYKNK